MVWQKSRKIASHVFTSRNIKHDMSNVFAQNSAILIQRLDQLARNNTEFDVQDLYFR